VEKIYIDSKTIVYFSLFSAYFFSENLHCVFQLQKTRSYTGGGKACLFPLSQEIRNSIILLYTRGLYFYTYLEFQWDSKGV
jgi:hypothetical protein